jgi:hypothetical protein
MTTRLRAWTVLWLLTVVPAMAGAASGPATVREYKKVVRTYPFSDPNPIPVVGRIYPYFRLDGYTDTPVDKEWTVVELENDYLRVTVFPEVGGLLGALSLEALGRHAEAVTVLDEWVTLQTNAGIGEWGRRVFAGQPAVWPADARSNEEQRAVTAWLGPGVRQ